MKIRKFWSVFCAVALLISALPAVSAAKIEPLSKNAGQTIAVHVTHVNAEGQRTQKYINVDIPQNATAQKEHELIQSAALATVDRAASLASDFDYLCTGAVRLSNAFKYITTIYMEHDYKRLVFEFNGGECTDNPTTVSVRLTNDDFSFTVNAPLGVQTGELKCAEVIIYDNTSYGGNLVTLPNGAYFEVESKLNRGSALFNGFIVKGYY